MRTESCERRLHLEVSVKKILEVAQRSPQELRARNREVECTRVSAASSTFPHYRYARKRFCVYVISSPVLFHQYSVEKRRVKTRPPQHVPCPTKTCSPLFESFASWHRSTICSSLPHVTDRNVWTRFVILRFHQNDPDLDLLRRERASRSLLFSSIEWPYPYLLVSEFSS